MSSSIIDKGINENIRSIRKTKMASENDYQ